MVGTSLQQRSTDRPLQGLKTRAIEVPTASKAAEQKDEQAYQAYYSSSPTDYAFMLSDVCGSGARAKLPGQSTHSFLARLFQAGTA